MIKSKSQFTNFAAALLIGMTPQIAAPADAGKTKADKQVSHETIERGRYLVTVGNCNDCHTARFPERDGKVPESEWLSGGGALGLRGPGGTTYASNLRLTASKLSEADWVKMTKTLKSRPPMP